MQKNPAIVRARLQQIQMELSKLALETTEPMAWQALHCANDSLGWAITNARLVAAALNAYNQPQQEQEEPKT